MFDRITTDSCLSAADIGGVLYIGLWVMLAAVLAIGGLYVVVAVKRWSQQERQPEPLTLHDLREMCARNEISKAEFASLRQALLDRARVASPDDSSGSDDEPHAPQVDRPEED